MDKQNNTLDFDIAIIGGGLAGYSLAVALQTTNVSVALIDAQAPFKNAETAEQFDDRALALSYTSLRFLDDINISSDLLDSTLTEIRHIHISDRGNAGITRLSHRDANVDYLGKVILARNLGMALSKTLTEQSRSDSFKHFFSTQVKGIQHLKDVAVLVIEAPNSQDFAIQAKLVILAEGGQSSLSDELGIGKSVHQYGQVGILANLGTSQPHKHTAYERFTEHGPIALLPLRERDYKLVWTVPTEQADSVMAYQEQEFLNQLQNTFGDRAGIFEKVSKRVSYPMFEVRKSTLQMGRVVLIGNSAHTLHPIAGQGFNLGLRDIACLTNLIQQRVSTGQSFNTNSVYAITQAYEEQRTDDVKRTTIFTDGLVKGFSNKSVPKAMIRNLGLTLMDASPQLKGMFVKKLIGNTAMRKDT